MSDDIDEMAYAPFEDLEKISNRLYAVWQALRYGDEQMNDHCIKIARELGEILLAIENINENEGVHQRQIDMKMQKFEQGFAYGRKGHNGQECL